MKSKSTTHIDNKMKLPKYIQKYLTKESNKKFLFSEIQKTLPIDFEEFMLLSAAFRYYMGRTTISAATFPARFITDFYTRLSADQKEFFLKQLKIYLSDNVTFGMKEIDHPIWMKLYCALDSDNHKIYAAVDGNEYVCFHFDGKIYPLSEYLQHPNHDDIYLPEHKIATKF